MTIESVPNRPSLRTFDHRGHTGTAENRYGKWVLNTVLDGNLISVSTLSLDTLHEMFVNIVDDLFPAESTPVNRWVRISDAFFSELGSLLKIIPNYLFAVVLTMFVEYGLKVEVDGAERMIIILLFTLLFEGTYSRRKQK